jgi:hypothetical protein
MKNNLMGREKHLDVSALSISKCVFFQNGSFWPSQLFYFFADAKSLISSEKVLVIIVHRES